MTVRRGGYTVRRNGESDDEPSNTKHSLVCRGALDDGTQNGNESRNYHCPFSAPSVREVAREGHGDYGPQEHDRDVKPCSCRSQLKKVTIRLKNLDPVLGYDE